MKLEKLKSGTISEKVVVDTFGTPKQKETYHSNSRFIGNLKSTLLKAASRYVEIVDLGDKKYQIVSIHKYSLPANMQKMQTGIYKYIIPLMLNKIINDRDKNNKVNFTTIKWARNVDMVNSNYNPMRYHKKDVYSQLNFDEKDVQEYFDKLDIQIQYFICQALEYIKKTGCIEWYKVNAVGIANSKMSTNGKLNFNIDLKKDVRRATEEETSYIIECKKKAMKISEIRETNENECYWGKKSKKYISELSKMLLEKDILFSYITYEAYAVDDDIDRLEFLLKQFNVGDTQDFIHSFNQEFKSIIMDNCTQRYRKRNDVEVEQLENIPYIQCFSTLSEITIDKNAKKFKISESNSQDEIELISGAIDDKLSVSLNGQILKIK